MDLILNISFILFAAGLFFFIKKMQSKKKPEQIKTLNITLTDEEKKIRADWMRSLFIMLLGNLAISFLNHSYFANYGNMELANEVLAVSLAATFSLSVGGAVIYGFAYIQFGTKWLKWILIFSPLKIAFDTILSLSDMFKLNFENVIFSYFLITHAVSIALFVYFWINNRRLYKLNCKIRDGFRAGLVV